MTIDEAIGVLRLAEYHVGIEYINGCENPFISSRLQKAINTVISACHTQQEAETNEPLTLGELREMCGEPVYIVNLTIEQKPPQYYPAVVFGWQFEDPFADTMDFNKRIPEITVVQPSPFAGNTQYWRAKTYGKHWLAYRQPPKEE